MTIWRYQKIDRDDSIEVHRRRYLKKDSLLKIHREMWPTKIDWDISTEIRQRCLDTGVWQRYLRYYKDTPSKIQHQKYHQSWLRWSDALALAVMHPPRKRHHVSNVLHGQDRLHESIDAQAEATVRQWAFFAQRFIPVRGERGGESELNLQIISKLFMGVCVRTAKWRSNDDVWIRCMNTIHWIENFRKRKRNLYNRRWSSGR